eukprot:SAG11_NODE_37099_length_258_cov_0.974843_1_plen_54_part_10
MSWMVEMGHRRRDDRLGEGKRRKKKQECGKQVSASYPENTIRGSRRREVVAVRV